MEIIPSVGIAQVHIGATLAGVEQSVGKPSATADGRGYYDDPPLVIHFDGSGLVELIEIPYGHGQNEEVTLDGVQLTFRFMDDVLRDLTAKGYASTPSDIGHSFFVGFAIFSMSSCDPQEIDPTAGPEDDRRVVEGVSVAPHEYFLAN